MPGAGAVSPCMALTDPPDGHLHEHPELLRLAALLLRDPPATPHITHEVTARTLGVSKDGAAEALLAQLIFHAPDGPDASPDTLVREALALGLTRLADRETAELAAPQELGQRAKRRHDVYLQRFYELRSAGLKIQELELALRKRQATVDRQGEELGHLRRQVEQVAGLQQVADELPVSRRRCDMFKRRCERYEAWFALPADQRHPLGPELSDPKPEQTDPLDKHLWDALSADLSKRPLAALVAHYLDLATRKFGRWVQTPEDVHKLVGAALDDEAIALWASITRQGARQPDRAPELNPGDHSDGYASRLLQRMREDMGPPYPCRACGGRGALGEAICAVCMGHGTEPLVGVVENGPYSTGTTVNSGADLAAWLREDGGPDDKATAVLGEGGIRIMPSSDPAIVEALGLTPAPLADAVSWATREQAGETAEPLRLEGSENYDAYMARMRQAWTDTVSTARLRDYPASVPAVLAQRPARRRVVALGVGPFVVIAHFCGRPMALVSLRPPAPGNPITIGGHRGADFDVALHRARISVYGDGPVLFADVVQPGAGTTTVRLDYGQRLEFGDTVLHFFPDEAIPDSLYRPGGNDCNDILSLDEFKTEVARLAAALGSA